MMRKKRANLSPAEREDVRRLYSSGGFSLRKLAAHFGCGKSTIDRIVKEADEESVSRSSRIPAVPPDLERTSVIPKPLMEPLDFKSSKLEEINLDLQACRMRGQYNVLPSLHRLHLNLFDDCNALRQEQKEIQATIADSGLVTSILTTISQLPPVLRQQIEREILSKDSKIISFPTSVKND